MIKKFGDFIKESVNPYYGFYDAANGSMSQLISGLNKESINYEYDSYRNYLIIKSNEFRIINTLLDDSDIYKVDYGFAENNEYYSNPNDCVRWCSDGPIYAPSGVMM
jgi:hypothetical protein